jgi:hypothetical protein
MNRPRTNRKRRSNVIDKVQILVIGILIFAAGIAIGFLGKSNFISNNSNKDDKGSLVFKQTDLADMKSIIATQKDALCKNNVDSSTSNNSSQSGQFVASSQGKKYYPINCTAAQSLSEKNKIYFTSEAEAQAKGYTKSSSCN